MGVDNEKAKKVNYFNKNTMCYQSVLITKG